MHLFLFEEGKLGFGGVVVLKTNFRIGETIHAHQKVREGWEIKRKNFDSSFEI